MLSADKNQGDNKQELLGQSDHGCDRRSWFTPSGRGNSVLCARNSGCPLIRAQMILEPRCRFAVTTREDLETRRTVVLQVPLILLNGNHRRLFWPQGPTGVGHRLLRREAESP